MNKALTNRRNKMKKPKYQIAIEANDIDSLEPFIATEFERFMKKNDITYKEGKYIFEDEYIFTGTKKALERMLKFFSGDQEEYVELCGEIKKI